MTEPNKSVVVNGGESEADQGVESPVSEAQVLAPNRTETNCIPLYTPITPLHEEVLLGWITEYDATCRLKKDVAELHRDRTGALRRLYIKSMDKLPVALAILAGARPARIQSMSSKTVRRESVGDIFKAYAHEMRDLRLKKRVSNEELAKDGVFGKGGVDGAQ